MRKLLAALSAAALLLTGCDVYSLPLPGGADPGDDPMELTVQFHEVLDLVPHSSVKINDVSVGRVSKVDVKESAGGPGNYIAEVTVVVPNDSELPEETRAEIRQTSLLGEKFVSLEPPTAGTGELSDGDTIPIENTGRSTEVEEVLGALSLILNGGGVAQLKTIARELNVTLEGREDSARSVLRQVNTLVGQLDANKGHIVAALESLNGLAREAREHIDSIDLALDELPSALRSIDRQRDDLIRMLRALNRLSDVGVRVIDTTKVSTVQALRSLQPVLANLVQSGDSLVQGFHTLITYPIPDTAIGTTPTVAHNLQMGDYFNLAADVRLNLADGIGLPCTGLGELPEQGVKLCNGLSDLLKKCARNGPTCPQEILAALGGFLETLGGGQLAALEDRLNLDLGGLLGGAARGTAQRQRGQSSGRGSGGVLGGGGVTPKALGDTVTDLLASLGGLGRAEPGFGSGDTGGSAASPVTDLVGDPALTRLLAAPLAVQP